MGSDSDLDVMAPAGEVLAAHGVDFEMRVVSAHRTPDAMLEFGHSARAAGFGVIIAGAGGAAHLPGMLASVTTLPVIGVPVALARLDGLDSLLSIVQMPSGVPVATVAINGAANAAVLAMRILGIDSEHLSGVLEDLASANAAKAEAGSERVEAAAERLRTSATPTTGSAGPAQSR